MTKLFKCGFEVFGIVQGVSFRMYTEKKAKALGVRGWCMNTSYDTVKGEIEGEIKAFEEMKTWLQKTGSPTSRIDKTEFTNTTELNNYSFKTFEIRH